MSMPNGTDQACESPRLKLARRLVIQLHIADNGEAKEAKRAEAQARDTVAELANELGVL